MARPIVRAALGTTIGRRVLVSKFNIPDISAADFDNPVSWDLTACSETNNDEVESTGGTTAGTDVAEVPLWSNLVGLKLKTIIQGNGGEHIRWQLVKSPDNDVTAATFNTNWHTSDDTTGIREVRANQMAKGLVVVNSNALQTHVGVFVKRATLKRLGKMKEGDRLKFVLSKDATGSTCTVTQWGTLYFKVNA